MLKLTINHIHDLPGSHMDYHPEMSKTVGNTEELNWDIYKLKKLVLQPGYVLIGRRNLVRNGGRAQEAVNRY